MISTGEYFSVLFSVTFGAVVWMEEMVAAAVVCAAPAAVVVIEGEKGSSDGVGDPLYWLWVGG